jgi:hypothetical protein
VSEYGRLFEQASVLRRDLKELLPELNGNYTPADAKRIAREKATAFLAKVDSLADRWDRLEGEMKRTPG